MVEKQVNVKNNINSQDTEDSNGFKKTINKNSNAVNSGMPINRKMTLGEAVSKYPKTAQVMMSYGLHCIGCHVAAWESIEDGARSHGLSNEKIDEMVKEMNKVAR